MEQLLAAQKSSLLDSLSFAGPNAPVADYITSRSQITVYPQGSNIYNPSLGTKQIRFNISTTGPFVDLSTLAIQCNFKNNDTVNPMVVLGGNMGTLCSELRVYLGGTEVERISHYNRTEALIQRFVSTEKRIQLFDEGLVWAGGSILGNDFYSAFVPANTDRKIVWRPMAVGLFQQKNLIPTAFFVKWNYNRNYACQYVRRSCGHRTQQGDGMVSL